MSPVKQHQEQKQKSRATSIRGIDSIQHPPDLRSREILDKRIEGIPFRTIYIALSVIARSPS
jgi:hypothetical protein